MTDAELVEAKSYFDEYVSKREKKGPSYYSPGEAEDSAGVDYWADWGPWAAKLADHGFIHSHIGVKAYPNLIYDEEVVRKVGDDIREMKLRTDIYFVAEYEDLAELVSRAEKLLSTA